MYILSDRFLGNIKNSKVSYLKNNIFYYTNDGMYYKEFKIEDTHIGEGYLDSFFAKITIHPWIEDDIKKELSKFIDNESLYMNIKLSEDNDIKEINLVSKDFVDNKKLVVLNETVFPRFKNSKTTIVNLGVNDNLIAIDGNPSEAPKLNYLASICFPTMKYRSDLNQFVFKTAEVFSYSS